MMNNNKILTVSYGTFSCTLEGFDDSFGTMKAIAEYFRDLASDDRYFGAEPPVPDAEMLARIAEREISRRVEAREHEGRIVLSASETGAASTHAPAPTAAALAVAAASVDAQDTASTVQEHAASEDVTSEDVASEDVVSEEMAAEDAAVEVADATTDNISDVVAQDDNAADAETVSPDETDEAPETGLAADTTASDASDADASDEAHEDLSDVVEETPEEHEDSAAAFFAEADDSADDAVETQAEEMVADDVADAPAPDHGPESIAAKLQRIRAVVSQSQSEDDDDDDMFEDEHAEDLSASADDAVSADLADAFDGDDTEEAAAETDDASSAALADAVGDIEAALDADDEAHSDANDVEAEDDSDDIEAILARFDEDASDTKDDVTAVQEEADDEDDIGLDSLVALLDDEDSAADDDADENLFDTTSEHNVSASGDDVVNASAARAPAIATAETLVLGDAVASEANVDGSDSSDEGAEAASQATRQPRIMKVKRADLEAAIESGQLEAVEDEDDIVSEPSLSPEDEAELMADLAAVESELSEVEDEVDAKAAENTDESDDSANTAFQDDDVDRLMAEADNQMDEPEGSRRRNAFAHLKAAVMAKKADNKIGEDKVEDEGQFRSDLASVVIPRRPEARGDGTERPDVQRPAPLKLVAEQRVDVDAAPQGPVRPRRVAAAESASDQAEGESGGFADYAAELGAHNLPDLLEAAASYLSFVEGRDQFSRPQIMNKVRQVEQNEFSREDGLRSFGQLLRTGKIEKLKGGRFAVTGDIGYRPDQRAAS